MRERITGYLDSALYWLIILIPFSIAISSAPVNVFAGWLIAVFLAKRVLKKERIFNRTAIDLPLFLLFVLTCLSLLNSIDLADSLKGGVFKLARYITILLIMAAEVKDKKHIAGIIFSIAIGLALACVDSVWQVASGRDFIRGYLPIWNIGLVRATASFSDANTLGIYLSALTPVVLGLTLYYFKGKKKLLFVLLSILALAGSALTYSRPTLLAVYAALFFLAVARKNKLLIAGLLVFTLISPLLLPGTVKDWAKKVDYNPLRFMCNDDRIAIFRHSINMIKDHPVIGVGANTFMKNYRFYKEYPPYRNAATIDYLYAHNNFLHMAGEIGLFGLAVFLWLLYKLFAELGRIYRALDEPYLKVVLLSLIASLIAFQVNGLTESSLYSSRVAVIFWYLAGFALGFKRRAGVRNE